MSLKLNSSGGGSITLQEPSTASNRTLTLPDNTGNLISSADSGTVSQTMLASGVAGNGPSFRAYRNATQSISSNTFTKVQFNAESWDTNNCFDSTTNYRFTPNVAGYYLVCWQGSNAGSNTASYTSFRLYKNGALNDGAEGNWNPSANAVVNNSALIYLNGTTDYLEIFAYLTASTAVIGAGEALTYFSASLMRAA